MLTIYSIKSKNILYPYHIKIEIKIMDAPGFNILVNKFGVMDHEKL